MSILIPEILGTICSFLEVEDVRSFRLCCSTFADIGAYFAHRNVVFYLHHDDFDMLQRISQHPTASKNVRSLVYMGQVLITPKMTLERFRYCYSTLRYFEKCMARRREITPPPYIGLSQLDKIYEEYGATVDKQDEITETSADFSLIREAVSRFPALQEIIVNSDDWFWKGKKSPFDSLSGLGSSQLEPIGCRHLDSLLDAVFAADIKLKKLSAGAIGWQFFQKPRAQLGRALSFLTDLTCLRLVIDASDKNSQCEQLIDSGLLRGFIKSLTKLQTLYIAFTWDPSRGDKYLPRLDNVLEPKHRWEDLEDLSLGYFTCERQDLMSLLKRHKNTLRDLCLQDIYFGSTSWQILLPKIRKTMDLDHACLCGELYGIEEWSGYEEFWDLDDQFRLREDVNDYLVNDNIKKCPLNKHNVAEYEPMF
ncbi:hypothetical protein GGR52DRAFT_521501 [Hypoxylon sp. FL1284]|nr:hypothetical protein GGR52DRAFT_521501 [Hypoxylon sp. FL1284]